MNTTQTPLIAMRDVPMAPTQSHGPAVQIVDSESTPRGCRVHVLVNGEYYTGLLPHVTDPTRSLGAVGVAYYRDGLRLKVRYEGHTGGTMYAGLTATAPVAQGAVLPITRAAQLHTLARRRDELNPSDLVTHFERAILRTATVVMRGRGLGVSGQVTAERVWMNFGMRFALDWSDEAQLFHIRHSFRIAWDRVIGLLLADQ